MTLEEAFQTLGVRAGSSAENIKKAFRRKALELHPDRRSHLEKSYYEDQFRKLKEAYELVKQAGPLPVVEEQEREPVETQGWGPEIKVPQSRWRDHPNREPESAPLADKLGLRLSWDLESWALWLIMIPAAAVAVVLIVKLLAAWANPAAPPAP